MGQPIGHRSLDLTPGDFFLKELVHANHLTTLEKFRAYIEREIDVKMCSRVIVNRVQRLDRRGHMNVVQFHSLMF